MSRSPNPRCTYTYHPPDDVPQDDRVEIDRPSYARCPHNAIDSDDSRCLFHHGQQKYPSDRFTEQFLDALSDSNTPPSFAGGHLASLELQGETVTTPSGEPIDLRGATIDGDLDLTDATIEVPLLLDGAAITGSLHTGHADFQAPLTLVNADIRGRISWYEASVDGGISASNLNAGYVDARKLTVEGTLILDGASFTSSLRLARADIDGDMGLADTTLDWGFDGTAMTIGGDFVMTDSALGDDLDVVATRIDGDADLRKCEVGGDTDWSHSDVGGDFVAPDCTFEEEAIFDDVAVGGHMMVFDNTHFGAKADFGTLSLPDSHASFSDVKFDGEAWFTHATIGGRADFGGSTFHDMSHLRDATFEGDLVLRNVRTTDQFFLHGSTVLGDCDSTDAHFKHFQFSATVEGKSDFSRARFEEKALFRSSTFGDRVWFDHVSFAGHPDFYDARFTDKTTFVETEFLVNPTFEDTRFAIEPDLSEADFSLAEAIDFEDRREQMILAHPESLRYNGETLPLSKVAGDFSVPAKATHLVEDDPTKTKLVANALADFDGRSWHSTFEQSLRTARTAVAQLSDADDAVIVFGLSLKEYGKSDASLVKSARVAGVYCRSDGQVVFGHLDPTFFEVDYLVPVPASNDAFESGAAVATSGELHKAAVRNEMFRAALLGKQTDVETPVNQMVVPVLVGAVEIP